MTTPTKNFWLSWLIFLVACTLVHAADWPQWRGPGRDGHVPSLPESMPPLKVLWRQKVAGPCDAGIAVADGMVVSPDHDDENDYYCCYDAASGKEMWKRAFPNGHEMDYGAGPRTTPLVSKGKVYVLGALGDLHALDLKTGKTVWQKDLPTEFGVKNPPKWGYCSSPLVADGKLIVNPGGKVALAALHADTGEVLWRGAGAGINYASFLAGTFGEVEQVVGYDARTLGGWELKTGQRLWTVEVEASGGYMVPTPVNVGGKLLITDQNNQAQLFTFDRGGVIRETPLAKSDDLAPEVPSAVLAGDLILGHAERIVCLDAADGLKTLWTQDEEPAFQSDCHLIVAGGRGLAFNKEGELVLFRFDREGVKVLGKKSLCGKTLMHPTIAAGRLYVRDSEALYCYDFAATEPRAARSAPDVGAAVVLPHPRERGDSATVAPTVKSPAVASGKAAEANKLVGTWRLVAIEERDANGKPVTSLDYGPDPVGMIMYDATGHMSVHAMRRGRPRLASDDVHRATPEQAKAAFVGYGAYFGTYEVDQRAGLVIHHVEGSLIPNWEGSHQRRQFTISGDKLTLEPPGFQADGQPRTRRLTWQRVQ
jgi:outer membrane protein assembly factor BamB